MFDELESDITNQDFKNYENNPTISLDFTLTGKTISYIRSVVKIDIFLSNFIDYMYNIVMILAVFSLIYNSFGARVFISRRFFVNNPDLTDPIIKILKEKIRNKIFLLI